ncbi:hypothetical protein ES705_29565 [subsurface metagenome]
MLINAIYDNGKLLLPDKLKTKNEKISVVVEIPDDKLEVEDYLESIENEETRQLMYDLRKIRGTGPIFAGDKSDKDLLFDAFRLMREEGKLL